LEESRNVVVLGEEPNGYVFAVVKVANGTKDQQEAAVNRWAEDIGQTFRHVSGIPSYLPGSTGLNAMVLVGALHHTNWKAVSLETSCFERYQTQGDYGKPLKLERRGVATPSERAAAYVEAVPLDVEGTRDTNLHGAAWNIGDKLGIEALKAAAPLLLARSTLPEKRKRTIINRAITRTEKKEALG
jgi:hypothetical protein